VHFGGYVSGKIQSEELIFVFPILRAYREKQLENSGLQPIFPVWDMPTRELARSMIKYGVRAKLTCVDPKLLAPEFVGREFDEQLLSEFPPDIDPCGENGEFHRPLG